MPLDLATVGPKLDATPDASAFGSQGVTGWKRCHHFTLSPLYSAQAGTGASNVTSLSVIGCTNVKLNACKHIGGSSTVNDCFSLATAPAEYAKPKQRHPKTRSAVWRDFLCFSTKRLHVSFKRGY